MKSDSFTYYEIVAEEIRSGNLQSGVWAKAYADASGVKETAQALYIRYRVAQLAEAARDQDRGTSAAAGSDHGEASSQRSSTPLYFPVSLLKFAMMSIVTFGLYEVHWFYKNWDFERSRTQERLHAEGDKGDRLLFPCHAPQRDGKKLPCQEFLGARRLAMPITS